MDDNEARKMSASKDNNWLGIICQLEIWFTRVGAIETFERIKLC